MFFILKSLLQTPRNFITLTRRGNVNSTDSPANNSTESMQDMVRSIVRILMEIFKNFFYGGLRYIKCKKKSIQFSFCFRRCLITVIHRRLDCWIRVRTNFDWNHFEIFTISFFCSYHFWWNINPFWRFWRCNWPRCYKFKYWVGNSTGRIWNITLSVTLNRKYLAPWNLMKRRLFVSDSVLF